MRPLGMAENEVRRWIQDWFSMVQFQKREKEKNNGEKTQRCEQTR